MANQITGKILHIGDVLQVATKDASRPLLKRSVVLDCTRFDPYTGERDVHENTPELEFAGEKLCEELKSYEKGEVVTVSFDVRGARYTTKDGKQAIFTRLVPYRIEKRQRSGSTAAGVAQQTATDATPQENAPQNEGEANDLPF